MMWSPSRSRSNSVYLAKQGQRLIYLYVVEVLHHHRLDGQVFPLGKAAELGRGGQPSTAALARQQAKPRAARESVTPHRRVDLGVVACNSARSRSSVKRQDQLKETVRKE